MGKEDKFLRLTMECIECLKEDKKTEICISYGYDTPDDTRWEHWHDAAYDEPGFLYTEGNPFDIFDKCRGKDVKKLNIVMIRGCITALLREMRNGGIDKDTLIMLLERWLELAEQQE